MQCIGDKCLMYKVLMEDLQDSHYINRQKVKIYYDSCSEITAFELGLKKIANEYGLLISYTSKIEEADICCILTDELAECRKFYAKEINSEEAEKFFGIIRDTIQNCIFEYRKRNKSAYIIIFTLPYYIYSFGGVQECVEKNVTDVIISKINIWIFEILDYLSDSKLIIFPYHRYASSITRSIWNEKFWENINEEKCCKYSRDIIYPVLGLLQIIYPLYMQRKKAIVIDLDDTLWGGTLSEDGIENIKIGNDSYGYGYWRFQSAINSLQKKGLLVGIASKNEKSRVTEVIENLYNEKKLFFKPDDIQADFFCSKVDMINKICKDLSNITVDTIVFVDNSDIERENVKGNLPQIMVPQFPLLIDIYEELMLHMPYLQKISIDDSDSNRKNWYKNTTKKNMAVDIDVKCIQNETMEFNRVFELINKTNQFNLTGKRFSRIELAAEVKHNKVYAVKSKFDDDVDLKGEIFAVIVITEKNIDTLLIDNILMSCRYMGFEIEKKFMQFIYQMAIFKEKRYIEGKYIKTERNGLVKDFYSSYHFSLIDEENNTRKYRCLVPDLERILSAKEVYDINLYLGKKTLKETLILHPKKAIRKLDNAIEILIPSGILHKGITVEDAEALKKAYGLYPEHEIDGNNVQVNSFWMDQYCITNYQYCLFLNQRYKREEREKIILEMGNSQYFLIWYDNDTGKALCKEKDEDLPVIVNYDAAVAYSNWVGGRLPTEEEWEYAGKAYDCRWFPWGYSLPDYRTVNMRRELIDVHQYLESASPFGLVQLVGNVWQWCLGEFRNHHIYRGSDFRFDSAYWKRLQIRPLEAAEHCGNLVGIRIVRDI